MSLEPNKERKIKDRLGHIIFDEGVSDQFLLDICQMCEDALNLKKPLDYAREHDISRQHAYSKAIDICQTKRVIDNY